ncbi:Protein of unknown function [Leuconostoc citreum]|nr:Protein of unknown function [Leuconostoc citreum]
MGMGIRSILCCVYRYFSSVYLALTFLINFNQ